ncbi:MAG: PhzF family phenazine biosynthesis protein, partial [Candidatus Dormibacteraeota bacterium]|nr:PhzF family phenazine biosynthesis protein [Candidatus Dormibacteraeota bacterium]
MTAAPAAVIGGVEVLKYTAFAHSAEGGNPAGVVLGPGALEDPAMLAIAAEVGYSETAFIWPLDAPNSFRVRYFSPASEVPFCGHATIASGIALADHGVSGDIRLQTDSGEVVVGVGKDEAGRPMATLTSVTPQVAEVATADLAEALASLGWTDDDLDPGLPPRVAYAGAYHLVLGVRSRQCLADMRYEFERLRVLMNARAWTTAELVWRAAPLVFHARAPFPVGGVVEDPATGAAAAAFGAYLR